MYSEKDHSLAGNIATKVLDSVRSKVLPGVKLSDIADWVESEIIALGGQPAFPCSVAVNEYAAHYAPLFNDISVIPEKSMVKVDLGVHINGYICDCATTVNFNPEYEHLVKASKAGLKAGVESIKHGATISEIGTAIHAEIKNHNANPIYNLSGHTLDQYSVHSGLSILNHQNPSTAKLEKGMVLAIEPFATNGMGYVHDHGNPGIYSILGLKNARSQSARKILSEMFNQRRTLPFAERWLHKIEKSRLLLNNALREISEMGIVETYPPLREKDGCMVSQHECTVLVEDNGARIIGGENI
jgi:methionyl aminopeptidase